MFNVALAAVEDSDPQPPKLKLGGYYKNLFFDSKTVFPAGEAFGADLNRLRLELEGKPAAWTAFDIQYDNEVLFGSYLRTAQFAIL